MSDKYTKLVGSLVVWFYSNRVRIIPILCNLNFKYYTRLTLNFKIYAYRPDIKVFCGLYSSHKIIKSYILKTW